MLANFHGSTVHQFTDNTAHLLQQRHPLRLGIPTAADDAAQVDAAGHPGVKVDLNLI